MHRDEYRTGIALVIISAVCFSTAGLFSKGIELSSWSIIFWRSLLSMFLVIGYIAIRQGGKGVVGMIRTPFSNWKIAAVSSAGTAAFIPAFKLTSIANVVLLYAMAPFLAALIAWIWIGERTGKAALMASTAAFSGAAVIVWGSLGGGDLRGDLFALFMTFCMAAMMVMYRLYESADGGHVMCLSSIMLMVLSAIFINPMDVTLNDLGLLTAFGAVHAVSFITLAEGARRLPSAETALLGALETPLAPIWAWLIFAQIPAPPTFTGGAIILVAVLTHGIRQLRSDRS